MTVLSSTLPEDDDGSDNRDWFVDEDDNDIEIVSLLDSQEPIATTASIVVVVVVIGVGRLLALERKSPILSPTVV